MNLDEWELEVQKQLRQQARVKKLRPLPACKIKEVAEEINLD